ncbi:MAG: polysaccharide biosynthesis/export family protein [Hyphomicrobiaceae bacterium]
MSLRFVALAMAAALLLTGCARHRAVTVSATDAYGVQVPADAPIVSHSTDEPPLADDPVTESAPMPTAGTASLDWTNAVATVDAAPESEEAYLLDSGDRVRVFVYGQPNLSRVYPIDGQGFIAMPLIGNVRARATTTYDLSRRIAGELSVSYVRDPEVSVEVASYRPFYILGEVRSPGQFSYVSGMTVRTAIAIAGGYTPRANERSVVVTRTFEGEEQRIDVPPSYRLRPGDTVTVKERWF